MKQKIKLLLLSFKQETQEELASSNSSILNGFHARIVASAEIDTSVLSTSIMLHTASV